jgi:hypothetical protein
VPRRSAFLLTPTKRVVSNLDLRLCWHDDEANKQALRIREVQCPNCKARFLFRRARVPHFDSSGLESCTFNCKFCRASLAGVIDPYDGALLLSVVVCAPAPGLHEAGTGRYQRQHEPIYPEAWSQSPKAPAIPSSQSRLARGGGSEKISSAATSPLDQLRGSADMQALMDFTAGRGTHFMTLGRSWSKGFRAAFRRRCASAGSGRAGPAKSLDAHEYVS